VPANFLLFLFLFFSLLKKTPGPLFFFSNRQITITSGGGRIALSPPQRRTWKTQDCNLEFGISSEEE